ncbi:MAG: ABC transporter substrate-binding protein [Gemmatimonadetes bacterium]|nr:ABC transporter substrate-binding protein [Gemmatimonadota bacterium]
MLRSGGAALLLLACGDRPDAGDAAGGEPARGGTVVIAASTDLDFANALVSGERYTQELLRYTLFLPLVAYDSVLGYEPVLARSWQLTADTGVIFELRDDVHWHDGVRTSAADVVFTFERVKDPATGFPFAESFRHWTDAVLIDSLRVRFHWTAHTDPLAGLPFTPVMPRHLLDTVPSAAMRNAPFNRQPVGNGPFRFVESLPNDRWVFEANPDFPAALGGRPFIDRLVWRVIPDNTAQVTELQTGNADVVLNARPETFTQLARTPAAQPIEREARQYAFIGWNGRRAPFGDARVRRALTMALDRQRMLDGLRAGRGRVSTGPVGRFHWAFVDSLAPLPYDTAAARALLVEAGIRDRNGDGVLDVADGRPFEFTLKLPANNAFNRDMAELIASDLQALGIRAQLQPLEFGTLVGQIMAPSRDFDAVLMGWESDFRLSLRALFHSGELGGPFQLAGYANPEVDGLLDRAATEIDRATALPDLARLQAILRDEQPWTFLYSWDDLYLASARLRGVRMDIRGAFVSLPRWWVADASSAAR